MESFLSREWVNTIMIFFLTSAWFVGCVLIALYINRHYLTS